MRGTAVATLWLGSSPPNPVYPSSHDANAAWRSYAEGGDAMKRTLTIALFGLSAAALFGCPVFSGSGGPCGNTSYCCNTSWDCPSDELCDPYTNLCVAPPSEASLDDVNSVDCTITGCPNGQVCAILDGGVECVASSEAGLSEAGGEGGSGESGTSESGTADATSDAASDAPLFDAPLFTGCTSAADCSDGGAGTLCLDGQCVPPSNQCTDTTQCPNSEECVQGGCVPACSATALCPTGYSCTTNGVCTGNPTPCGSLDGGAAACAVGTMCVEQHCVTSCGAGDAACASGLVCVDGGCLPEEIPVFTCTTDGVRDVCAEGSICLHHSCYIACDPEASTACATADVFNICKPVTTSSGTHYVCASSTNLGSQCDPTRDLSCATSTDICIDGFCR